MNKYKTVLGLGFFFSISAFIAPGFSGDNLETINVYVNKNTKHHSTRAGLRAQKKIFAKSISNSISFPGNISNNKKVLIRSVYYQNYNKQLKIKKFKQTTRSLNKGTFRYSFSYEKLFLPKITSSNVIKKIGHQISNASFIIKPIQAIELSLAYPEEIPLDASIRRWRIKYTGSLKHVFDESLISNLKFLKSNPVDIDISDLPSSLSELLMLNDIYPLNSTFCFALTEKLYQKNYDNIFQKLILFCLKSPKNGKYFSQIEEVLIKHNIKSNDELSRRRERYIKVNREMKLFSNNVFNIKKYNSISKIINSMGELPILLPRGLCRNSSGDIKILMEKFKTKHSDANLGAISNWFLLNGFPLLSDTLENQLKNSTIQEKTSKGCNRLKKYN